MRNKYMTNELTMQKYINGSQKWKKYEKWNLTNLTKKNLVDGKLWILVIG